MPEELRLGVKLVEILFKKPTWMARSAEECEMELHHRHSCLDTLGDLMMFFPLERNDSFVDPPVADTCLAKVIFCFSSPVRSHPIKEAKGWDKQRNM